MVYEARYLAWNCELKTRLSDIVSHLRNCCQIVIIAVFFFLILFNYGIQGKFITDEAIRAILVFACNLTRNSLVK